MSGSANLWLIIGLTVALALLVVLIIVVIEVVLCQRRGVKKTEQRSASNDNIELSQERQYTAINPANRVNPEYSTIAPTGADSDLYKAGREYSSVDPPATRDNSDYSTTALTAADSDLYQTDLENTYL